MSRRVDWKPEVPSDLNYPLYLRLLLKLSAERVLFCFVSPSDDTEVKEPSQSPTYYYTTEICAAYQIHRYCLQCKTDFSMCKIKRGIVDEIIVVKC